MELSKLDIILASIGTASSFRNFESKIELSGKKCYLLDNHIKSLEKLKSDIKEYLVNMSVVAETNTEKTMIIELLKIIKESEEK